MMTNQAIIYGLRDKTKTIKYIGKTINIVRRLREHKRERKWIKDHIILEICNQANWKGREKYWIEKFKHNSLYNCNPGGGGSFAHTEEAKRKISEKQKEIQANFKLTCHPFIGPKRKRGPVKIIKPPLIGPKRIKGGGMLGKTHSIETKVKMSIARAGRITSEITKEKIGKAHLGKILSEETKAKIGAGNRKPKPRKK